MGFYGFAPYFWDEINLHDGCYVPSELHPKESEMFCYFQRALFQRLSSVIKLGVPKEWEGGRKEFLYWCLTRQGFVYAGKSKVYGKIFSVCTLYGHDFFYQPTDVLLNNPYNMDPELKQQIKLDENGTLIKWTPDFMGTWDIVNLYAEKLALLMPVEDISIRNNAMSWVYLASTPQAAASFKKAMDEIYSGKPGVVVDKKLLLNDVDHNQDPFQFLDRKNIAQSYILDKLLTDFNTILSQFDAEIGIPTMANQSKKERMVVSEAESRMTDARARSEIWLECLKSSIEHLNEVVGEDFGLTAELRYKPEEGEKENSPLEKSPEEADASSPEGRES